MAVIKVPKVIRRVVSQPAIRVDNNGDTWTIGFCHACLFGLLETVELEDASKVMRCVDCGHLQQGEL